MPDSTDETGTGSAAAPGQGVAGPIQQDPGQPRPSQATSSLDQPDSPNLPDGESAAVSEAVNDRKSRRHFRTTLVFTTVVVLIVLLLNLTWVVCTVTSVFKKGLDQRAIVEAVAGQVVSKTASAVTMAASSSGAPASSAVKDKAKTSPGEVPKLRIEASIFGEIRDALAPIVALVSILTVAVVVILVTILKSSFAQDKPLKGGDASDGEGFTIPAPTIEALKGLVDAIKSVFAK